MIDPTTCPPALRDECELRYILDLPTKAERADYLDRAERYDGKASTDRLRQRVADAWHAARACATPLPCRCVVEPGAQASVHPQVNAPSSGSSLDLPHEGSLRRVDGVVSEAVA